VSGRGVGSTAAAAAILLGLLAGIAWQLRPNVAEIDREQAPRGAVAGAAPPGAAAPVADPPQAAPATPPRRPIPEVLPDFSLGTVEGPLRALSTFRQPSLVINFWATWCAPCRREIPLLRQIRAERAAKGVEVVGIAVDFREDVLRFARQTGIDYPLLIGEQDGLEAANAFGLDLALPFTIFSDANRRIIAVKIGELHRNDAEFILDRVADVNAGKLSPLDARRSVAAALQAFEEERNNTPSSTTKRP
jgi:thiol-disulfide isomerase/thioredoxin